MRMRSGWFSAAGCLLALALTLMLGACSTRGGEGRDAPIPRAPDMQATRDPNHPDGWERFDEGDFGGYAPEGSQVVHLPADVLRDSASALEGIDEDLRPLLEAAMESMDGEIFFVILGGEFGFGSNINVLPCEVDGQRIWGESIITLGFMALGLEFEEVDEVAHGDTSATVFRTRLSDEFETLQLVLMGEECNLLVTLTLVGGEYEEFAPEFKEFIRLFEFRGGPAIE